MRISDWSSDVCSSDLLVGRSHDAVDAVADDAERVDIEAAVGLVEDGEAGGDEAHLDDLVALLLAARKADIHVELHHFHRAVERVGLLAGEEQEIAGANLVLAPRAARGLDRGSPEWDVGDGG